MNFIIAVLAAACVMLLSFLLFGRRQTRGRDETGQP